MEGEEPMSIEALPLSERDRVEHMLARQMYLRYCNHRKSEPNRAPYVPAWAGPYAAIATTYLGWDEEAIDALLRDYK